SAASGAGLKAGDRVLMVDGTSCYGYSASKAPSFFDSRRTNSNARMAPPRVVRMKRASRNCDLGFRWRCDPSYYYPVVETVDDESPALTSGLRTGDLILSIDGLSADNRTVEELKELFDRGDVQQQLIVVSANVAHKLGRCFKRIPEEKSGANEKVDLEHKDNLPVTIGQAPTKISTHQHGTQVIEMKKESALDFFGNGWLADSSFFPLVTDVEEESPASSAGLKGGHRILRINGTSAFGCTIEEATALLSRRGNEQQLLVIDDSEVEEWYEKNRQIIMKESIDEGRIEIQLPVQRDELGARVIRMGKISPSEFFGYYWNADPSYYPKVVRVDDESPSSRAGLRSGDKIISINGFDAYLCTFDEVRQLFDRCGVEQQLIVINEQARDAWTPEMLSDSESDSRGDDSDEDEEEEDEVEEEKIEEDDVFFPNCHESLCAEPMAWVIRMKKGGGVGTGFICRSDPSFYPIVTGINPGLPSKLRVHDLILIVDGKSARRATHIELQEMFTQDIVEVVVIAKEEIWKNFGPSDDNRKEKKQKRNVNGRTYKPSSRLVELECGNEWSYSWLPSTDNYPVIVKVNEHSRAFEAGLRRGDQILSVDGINTFGAGFDKVTDLLRGLDKKSVKVVVMDEE
ncbi:hypothetical protein PFISCL1PPCAC_12178, partial [Pristionchus fissidentatus]